MKKFIQALSVVLLVSLLLCGCELPDEIKDFGAVIDDAVEAEMKPGKTKTYSHAGVTFELPNTFLDFTGTQTAGDYPFLYANDTFGLLGVQENKEEFVSTFGEVTLKGYAELIAQLYTLETTVTEKDGFVTMTYEAEGEESSNTFVCVFYETETDFWNIQCYCETSLYEKNQDKLWEYASGATFDK